MIAQLSGIFSASMPGQPKNSAPWKHQLNTLRRYQKPVYPRHSETAAATITDLDDDAADTPARVRCPPQLLRGKCSRKRRDVFGTGKKGAKRPWGRLPADTPQEERVRWSTLSRNHPLHSVL